MTEHANTTVGDAGDFDAFERGLWAGRAEAYGNGFARMTAHTVQPLLDAARVGEGTRLLDVGTGPGTVARAAVDRGALVTAVDAEPQMAALAARTAPEADIRVAVLPDLPLPDDGFDAVAGNFVINHVGRPDRALDELRRVLRADGRIALTCWHVAKHRATAVVSEAMAEAGVPWPDDVPLTPFRVHGTPDAFAALLTAAGFTDVVVDEVAWEHRVDPELWWAGPRAGVGSNGVVLARQDPTIVAAVKRAYDRIVRRYATGDGVVALPARALLAHGTNPVS